MNNSTRFRPRCHKPCNTQRSRWASASSPAWCTGFARPEGVRPHLPPAGVTPRATQTAARPTPSPPSALSNSPCSTSAALRRVGGGHLPHVHQAAGVGLEQAGVVPPFPIPGDGQPHLAKSGLQLPGIVAVFAASVFLQEGLPASVQQNLPRSWSPSPLPSKSSAGYLPSQLVPPFFTQNLTRNSLHDRSCQDAREKTRWQVIWLHAQQTWEHRPSTRAVSQATGFSQNWVYKLIRRYNAEGAQGLIDKHRHNPGGDERASLNQEEQQALRRALPARPPDGGCGRPARWPPGFRRTPASAWPRSPPGPTCAAWVAASNAPATPALRARRLSKKVAQVVPSGSCTRISRWGSGARMRPGWA